MATGTICSTFDITLIAGAGALSFNPVKTFTTTRAFTIVGDNVFDKAACIRCVGKVHGDNCIFALR